MIDKCNYVNGKKEGLYEQWHENGQLNIKCHYVNDKKEGLYEQLHNNDQIESGLYNWCYKNFELILASACVLAVVIVVSRSK